MTLDAGALKSPALPAGATVWAAFSGGLDSTVLLHLLRERRLPVKALHVNHNLQQVAARWADHCRALCAQLGVAIYVIDVKVDPRDPDGPEAAARRARYEAFATVMRPGDCLATAHHQDDQAETVLLRLLRGSGVAGLAAMRAMSPLPPGIVWRPLLGESRASLKAYAERHQLPWVEDPHNLDSRYARSFLRSEVFPRLSQRWPQAVEQLARTADHCAGAVELLDELAAQDLATTARGQGLSVQRLLRLTPARRNNLLRWWTVRGGFELPTFDALQRLEREVLRARPDAAPVLAWGASELRRFRDDLHVMARLPPAPAQDVMLEWDGRADLALPDGCGSLSVLKPAKTELPLRVRFAHGGERLKPAGARFTRTLRNLFQEEGVPPWVRERMPLLELDGALAGVCDRWETADLKRLRVAAGCRFEWRHDLAGGPA